MGFGQIGQHRHSGQQGGHGNAGLHKHKWSWMIINDPDHFGKRQYTVPGARKTSKWLNVGDLETMLTKTSDSPLTLDLTAMGYDKLLGTGKVTHAFNIKVEFFTQSAKTKLEEAGGKIVS